LNIEFNNKIPVGVDVGHCSVVRCTVGSKVRSIVGSAVGSAFGVPVGSIGLEVTVAQIRR
jgi:hypothetical protein